MASERIEKLLAMQQKAEAQKRKAEQQLKAAKHKISIQRNKERTHRLCERGGHLEHYLPNPELLTDEDVFLLIDYFFSSPRVRELVEQMTASRRGELPQSPKELIDAAMQRMQLPALRQRVRQKSRQGALCLKGARRRSGCGCHPRKYVQVLCPY